MIEKIKELREKYTWCNIVGQFTQYNSSPTITVFLYDEKIVVAELIDDNSYDELELFLNEYINKIRSKKLKRILKTNTQI